MFRIGVALPVAVVFGLSGCATPGGTGEGSDTQASSDCNPAIGALIGGILGGLIDGNSRGRGAAIGAGVGALACIAANALTKQTRTAQQVEDNYRAQNKGSLPTESRVDRYNVSINPSDSVKAGGKFQVVSTIDVIQGSRLPIRELKERVTLFRSDRPSEVLATLDKVASQDAVSGTFENTFSFAIPQGVPQGSYPVQTILYLNGQVVDQRASKIYVVSLGSGALAQLQLR